jgi:hypothetical protein
MGQSQRAAQRYRERNAFPEPLCGEINERRDDEIPAIE